MRYRLTSASLAGLALLIAATGCSGDGGGTPEQAADPTTAASSAPPALPPGTAKLLTPADAAPVKECGVFTGEANLPADKTLILGVRNTDNGNAERYFQAVQDWEYPADLTTWTGTQYFGSKDSSVGQHFRVELLIINLAQATKAQRAAKKEGWHSPDNPPGTPVAAHLELVRVAGPGPAECS